MKRHRPAIQFYVGDWKKDPAVQSLSLTSRGLWFEMLLIMHEAPMSGRLVTPQGQPITEDVLARIVGSTTKQIQACLKEMEKAGTFSRDENGVIYSRRMVRDSHISEVRREAGRRGREARFAENLHQQNVQQNSSKTVSKSSASENVLLEFCSTKNTKNNEELEVEEQKKGTREVWKPKPREYLEAYPIKTKQQDATQAYLSIIETPEQHAALMAGLDRYKQSERWAEDDGKYICDPDKFVFKRMFEDFPKPRLPAKAGGKGARAENWQRAAEGFFEDLQR